jgi:ribose 5-phosphate isomerase B
MKGYETNYGTDTEESVDYPDFAHPVASDVAEGKVIRIVICGNGIAMTVNKHAAKHGLCWTKEIAVLTRLHNDANIVSIPARFTSIPQAVENACSATEFERHQNRVNKIVCQ